MLWQLTSCSFICRALLRKITFQHYESRQHDFAITANGVTYKSGFANRICPYAPGPICSAVKCHTINMDDRQSFAGSVCLAMRQHGRDGKTPLDSLSRFFICSILIIAAFWCWMSEVVTDSSLSLWSPHWQRVLYWFFFIQILHE